MKKQKEMLFPSPADNEIHAILLEEVDKQCFSLKPERMEDETTEAKRFLQYTGTAFVITGLAVLAYIASIHIAPPVSTQSITDSDITIVTLFALAIAAIGVGIYYLYGKKVNRQLRAAIHNKQYLYTYAPAIGLFIVRFQYKNDLYRCCIKRDTQQSAGKERP